MAQQPYPGLQFNRAIAEEAIGALQSAHQLLSNLLEARQSLASQMLQHWTGQFADQFRQMDLPDLLAQGNSLLEQIELTIAAIRAAGDTAAAQASANAAWQRQQTAAASAAAPGGSGSSDPRSS